MAERCRDLDPTRPVTNGLNGLLNLMADLDDEKAAQQNAEARAGGKNPMENLIATLNVAMGALMKILPILAGLKKTDRRTRDAFAALDIGGYNYMQSRYRKDALQYPDRVIVGSETMPSHTVAIWRDVEALPTVIGDFVWTGWDYIGEAGVGAPIYDEKRGLYRPWPARLAGLPLIDVTGHLQPLCYRNLLLWGLRADPYISVQPLDRAGQKVRMSPWRPSDSIRSWSWDGHEGTKATVVVYADAASVDLQLNGRSIGSAKPGQDSMAATFTLPYERGELVAVARDAAGREIGRDSLATAAPSLQLHVDSEVSELRADGDSLAYLNITLGDENGVLKPFADRLIVVDVSGAGTLAGFGSANPITEEGFASTTATSFQGRALAVVRSGSAPGEVRVTVSADGCRPVELTLPVK